MKDAADERRPLDPRQVDAALSGFEWRFGSLHEVLENVRMIVEESPLPIFDPAYFLPTADDLSESYLAYSAGRTQLYSAIAKFCKKYSSAPLPALADLNSVRKAFDPLASRIRGMMKISIISFLTAIDWPPW